MLSGTKAYFVCSGGLKDTKTFDEALNEAMVLISPAQLLNLCEEK